MFYDISISILVSSINTYKTKWHVFNSFLISILVSSINTITLWIPFADSNAISILVSSINTWGQVRVYPDEIHFYSS